MSKAFWNVVVGGFTRGSKEYGIPIAVAFVVGLTLGSYAHPYEQCKRMYDSAEEISECTWIKTNGR